MTKYILVKGGYPSGLDGSLVISQDEAFYDIENSKRVFDRFGLENNWFYFIN